MNQKTLVAITLCLMFIATVGGAASSIEGALSSLPGYEDALAASSILRAPGAAPSGSLRSLEGYQEQELLNLMEIMDPRSLPGLITYL